MTYPPSIPSNTRADQTPQAGNHPADHNAIANALTDIVNELGSDPSSTFASLTARLSGYPSKVRVTGTGDADLTGDGHGLQVGLSTGLNVAFDTNEIMARNNGAASALVLNADGGNVSCGAGLTTADDVVAGRDVIALQNPDAAANKPGAWLGHDGRAEFFQNAGAVSTYTIGLTRSGSPVADVGGQFIRFGRNTTNTGLGSITVASASSVSYNETCDPRGKRFVSAITDALHRVRQLGKRAYRGRWLADEDAGGGLEWDFLSSTDVEDVAPYAITGERDAVDGDGNPVFQQGDLTKLVPLLCAAIDELGGRLDRLEAAG
jgi:hypothetical protein